MVAADRVASRLEGRDAAILAVVLRNQRGSVAEVRQGIETVLERNRRGI